MDDRKSLFNEIQIIQKKLDKILAYYDKDERTPLQKKLTEKNIVEKNIVEKNSFSEQSFEFQTTHSFIQKLISNAAETKIKVPTNDNEFQKWCLHIDRLIRIDKATETQILKVIDFAVTDSFWRTNILSTQKLREKFNTLHGQMVQKTTPQKPKAKQSDHKQREFDFDKIDRLILEKM